MVWTALSAAPFDQGAAEDVGEISKLYLIENWVKSVEFWIPASLSHLKILMYPNGVIIVSIIAFIMLL